MICSAINYCLLGKIPYIVPFELGIFQYCSIKLFFSRRSIQSEIWLQLPNPLEINLVYFLSTTFHSLYRREVHLCILIFFMNKKLNLIFCLVSSRSNLYTIGLYSKEIWIKLLGGGGVDNWLLQCLPYTEEKLLPFSC